MATTPLFVEIIVIGVGAFSALALIVTAALDVPWLLFKDVTAFIFAFPFLALSYVLGIVVDRLADYLHSALSRQASKSRPFASMAEYHEAHKLIRYYSGPVCQHLEYTRSRMRICRGWSVNCVLLLLGANAWIWSQGNTLAWQSTSAVVVSGTLLLIFFGCLFSYWALGRSYHEQVFETHRLILVLTPIPGGGPPGANVVGAAIVSGPTAESVRAAPPQPVAR